VGLGRRLHGRDWGFGVNIRRSASQPVRPMNDITRSRQIPRRPSRLGLALTFGLLIGLLVWRWASPWSPFWVDLSALACAGVLLFVVRNSVRPPRRRNTEEPTRE
jgi:hypothetical protein